MIFRSGAFEMMITPLGRGGGQDPGSASFPGAAHEEPFLAASWPDTACRRLEFHYPARSFFFILFLKFF